MTITTIGTCEMAKGKTLTATVIPVSGGYAVTAFLLPGDREINGGWRLMPKRIYKTIATVARSATKRGYTVVND